MIDTMPPLCIYHANCADGFAAAYCVWQTLPDANFIPASYGAAPPDVAGRDVIIVDFSYKRHVLLEMAQEACSILVLDHHKTARDDLAGFPKPAEAISGAWQSHLSVARADGYARQPATIFDMDRSGAQMAWDFFCGGARPMLIEYVADRDLWKWEMEGSRAVSAVIKMTPNTFDAWMDLEAQMQADRDIGKLIERGELILQVQDEAVRTAIECSRRDMVIGGHRVPVANLPPFMASDAGHILGKGKPFAATYYDGPKGREFSLRSQAEGGEDVSAIAFGYGGGGHRNAAGFLVVHGWEGDSTAITQKEPSND